MFVLERSFKNKDLAQLKSVYRSVGWNKHNEDIIKKITATISYKVGNKDYEHTMERIKIKEILIIIYIS